MFDKEQIISEVKRIHFNSDSYWIVAGSAMVLHEVKEFTRDIDLGCTKELADWLQSQGYKMDAYEDGTRRIEYSDTIEIFEDWKEGNVCFIEGVPIVSLEGIIVMKEKLGREKDLKDIELIIAKLKRNQKMIELHKRTEEHVRIYYDRTQDAEIKALLPSTAKSVEEAIKMFQDAENGLSGSVGKTIYFESNYVGDIWCYGMDKEEIPNAMLSYCIFDKSVWNRGIAKKAVGEFLAFIKQEYDVNTVGAFTYADNKASIGVLVANGFELQESFVEDGRESAYYEKELAR